LNRLPVVVLSGSELQEDKRHAREVGADSYFVKPLSFDALVTMVKNLEASFPASGLDSTRDIRPEPGS
jgi:DNA-binding response OmpR family regulator